MAPAGTGGSAPARVAAVTGGSAGSVAAPARRLRRWPADQPRGGRRRRPGHRLQCPPPRLRRGHRRQRRRRASTRSNRGATSSPGRSGSLALALPAGGVRRRRRRRLDIRRRARRRRLRRRGASVGRRDDRGPALRARAHGVRPGQARSERRRARDRHDVGAANDARERLRPRRSAPAVPHEVRPRRRHRRRLGAPAAGWRRSDRRVPVVPDAARPPAAAPLGARPRDDALAGENSYVERWARVVEGLHAAQPAPGPTTSSASASRRSARSWRATIRPATSWSAAPGTTSAARRTSPCSRSSRSPTVSSARSIPPRTSACRWRSRGSIPAGRARAPDPRARRRRRRAGGVRARRARRQARHRRLRRAPNADGTKRTYPDPAGYVDYDGYIAIYDGDGKPVLHHDFNLGRGDVLAALRWLPDDIVAVGSSGWDRWQGGNSISRGADPLIAWMSPDGARVRHARDPAQRRRRATSTCTTSSSPAAPSSPKASPTPR